MDRFILTLEGGFMNKQVLITRFPVLRKIRKKQIKLFFYLKMFLDKNKYSKKIANKSLPYSMPEFKDKMINTRNWISNRISV